MRSPEIALHEKNFGACDFELPANAAHTSAGGLTLAEQTEFEETMWWYLGVTIESGERVFIDGDGEKYFIRFCRESRADVDQTLQKKRCSCARLKIHWSRNLATVAHHLESPLAFTLLSQKLMTKALLLSTRIGGDLRMNSLLFLWTMLLAMSLWMGGYNLFVAAGAQTHPTVVIVAALENHQIPTNRFLSMKGGDFRFLAAWEYTETKNGSSHTDDLYLPVVTGNQQKPLVFFKVHAKRGDSNPWRR
ncbi:MAG: hypothetical protein QOD99_795 [Chthoniobacter sp.]|jgi:hypothetical protein|nr:hypothetical protein [Chthoniobacter sp.]